MRKKIGLCLLSIAVAVVCAAGSVSAAKEDAGLLAAFVRGGNLWVKAGGRETKLADGPHIRNPKWSYDGAWLAYAKGEAEPELWVLNTRSGQSRRVAAAGGRSFQWAPGADKLAYLTGDRLQVAEAMQPDRPLESAEGIGNFAWLPDGSGFLVSTRSELLPDGWTPIILYRIPLTKLSDPSQYVKVHVLPKQSDDFFAVGTSSFKWSADGRWIAFLATPTASLSADANTLCALSADGVVFRTLDQMVNNEQWFEWGPKDAMLAYIEGPGREAGSNKRLKVLDVVTGKSGTYTPGGFVDNDFAWQGAEHIVVSRAKELSAGAAGNGRHNPHLLSVKLADGMQTAVTKPAAAFGDYNPQPLAMAGRLSWVRSDAKLANVIVARPNGAKAKTWLTGLDQADSYYGQWRWDGVLRFFGT
ncbi:hypothetical protein KP806_14385 [Paenibacillus sp. N4]|uniref:hypothetical protein n=1 Tax=Paenibacillus vietnamensis TaxID=2590547 RepID=UPI001CD15B9C|nr:hypothetical protein [Paenibacillus vietnamensis]MCA0756240.1 hypothetical protein [Paenibacillus vietnamensis]